MQCAYHPDREPVGACVSCGRLICVECKALLGGKIYCTPCADKIFVQDRAETIRAEGAEPVARQQPRAETQAAASSQEPTIVVEPQAAARPAPAIQPTTNTSGQGSASVLPNELKGWSWGAFALHWIWGIGNQVWISFVVFVLGFIWAIVLGIKGREWAWQSKKWDSIEHFKRTQGTWDKWGKILFIIPIAIGILYLIIGIVLEVTGLGRFG